MQEGLHNIRQVVAMLRLVSVYWESLWPAATLKSLDNFLKLADIRNIHKCKNNCSTQLFFNMVKPLNVGYSKVLFVLYFVICVFSTGAVCICINN